MMTKASSKPYQTVARRKQLGIGFFGLIFYAVVFGGLGLIGMKSFPIYSEHLRINRIIKKIVEDNPKTAQEAATIFERHSAIEDITAIRGTDLVVDTKSGKAAVSYKYSKKLPLIAPVSLIFDFEGSSH
jgi:Domain of unknown function (DUF4845)